MIQTPSLFRETINQPLTAGEEHRKFVKSLPGNMGHEILGNIEVVS